MFAVGTLFPLLALTLASAPTQPTCAADPSAATTAEAPILAAFEQRLGAYMELHNRVERAVTAEWLFEDARTMFDAVRVMQSGIRAERLQARRGDLFGEDVGVLIRQRLTARLAACTLKVDQVLAFINEERLPRAPRPAMHKPFPWSLGSAMPLALLPALPRLPDELQYRFADRDLVLIDMHADLVVDILPNALPAPSGDDGESTTGPVTQHR